MTTVELGLCAMVFDDGTVIRNRYLETRINDWRDTPWGKINFGCVIVRDIGFDVRRPSHDHT